MSTPKKRNESMKDLKKKLKNNFNDNWALYSIIFREIIKISIIIMLIKKIIIKIKEGNLK